MEKLTAKLPILILSGLVIFSAACVTMNTVKESKGKGLSESYHVSLEKAKEITRVFLKENGLKILEDQDDRILARTASYDFSGLAILAPALSKARIFAVAFFSEDASGSVVVEIVCKSEGPLNFRAQEECSKFPGQFFQNFRREIKN